ncbi:hypothetical protein FHS19_001374 [Paenibacillus rhizosphaerae]|uniref:DUF5590 domain-containing protein n=1 Tax=Paenibacillus rhizosphaerae TaxID=297318 RepID=A0A839TLW0_9BACL|nr:hypothetical protein [Paenibacillus rhizosphaerae]MBB3126720.1 hypothetical protein [Paenibacillus rhizosphaerae]
MKIRWLILLCFVLIAGCSHSPSTIEEAMNESDIPYDDILKTFDPDNKHTVVFYRNDHQYNVGLLKHKRQSWTWIVGTNSDIKLEQDIDWSYCNLNELSPMFVGTVNNKDIRTVIVETRKVKTEAQLISTSDGTVYWYVLLDEPQYPPMRFTGYDDRGQIVYDTGPLDD